MLIGSLPNGTKVTIRGLATVFRNVEVQRANACGTSIKGMVCSDGNWHPIQDFTISNSTPVDIRNDEEAAPVVEGKTERKTLKGEFKYPEGEFDMQQLAELNNITPANAYAKLHAENKCEVVREITGGRGRAKKIYKVK